MSMLIRVKRVQGSNKSGNPFDAINLHLDDQVIGPPTGSRPLGSDAWLAIAVMFDELAEDVLGTALDFLPEAPEDVDEGLAKQMNALRAEAEAALGHTRLAKLARSVRAKVLDVQKARISKSDKTVTVVSEDDI